MINNNNINNYILDNSTKLIESLLMNQNRNYLIQKQNAKIKYFFKIKFLLYQYIL